MRTGRRRDTHEVPPLTAIGTRLNEHAAITRACTHIGCCGPCDQCPDGPPLPRRPHANDMVFQTGSISRRPSKCPILEFRHACAQPLPIRRPPFDSRCAAPWRLRSGSPMPGVPRSRISRAAFTGTRLPPRRTQPAANKCHLSGRYRPHLPLLNVASVTDTAGNCPKSAGYCHERNFLTEKIMSVCDFALTANYAIDA